MSRDVINLPANKLVEDIPEFTKCKKIASVLECADVHSLGLLAMFSEKDFRTYGLKEKHFNVIDQVLSQNKLAWVARKK